METKPSSPKNDQLLRTTVLQVLASESQFSVLNIRVGVQNGIAHLGGNVSTLAQWEGVQQRIEGWVWIVNPVAPPGPTVGVARKGDLMIRLHWPRT